MEAEEKSKTLSGNSQVPPAEAKSANKKTRKKQRSIANRRKREEGAAEGKGKETLVPLRSTLIRSRTGTRVSKAISHARALQAKYRDREVLPAETPP
jgi:hypothetical protein